MRSAPTRLRGQRLLRLGGRTRVRGREVAAEVQPLAGRVGVRPRRRPASLSCYLRPSPRPRSGRSCRRTSLPWRASRIRRGGQRSDRLAPLRGRLSGKGAPVAHPG